MGRHLGVGGHGTGEERGGVGRPEGTFAAVGTLSRTEIDTKTVNWEIPAENISPQSWQSDLVIDHACLPVRDQALTPDELIIPTMMECLSWAQK